MPCYQLLQDHFANSVKQIPITNHEGTVAVHLWVHIATNLDMNICYMSTPHDKCLRNILTLIMPFGLFECLVLPQGISITRNIYKAWMSSLFTNMQPNAPILHQDDILHIKGKEHLAVLDKILMRLKKAGM